MSTYEQRIGNAHRTHVLDLLGRALAEGYLTLDEYESRTVAVASATLMSEILAQLSDLPPQLKWDPSMPLLEDIEKARKKTAETTAAVAVILGAVSIPLGFCLIGVLVGIAAIVVSFLNRSVTAAGWRNVKLARALGAGGVAVGVIIFAIALITSDNTSVNTTKGASNVMPPTPIKSVTATSSVNSASTNPSSSSPANPASPIPGAAKSSAASSKAPTSTNTVVPDGVGKNYQQAQDMWRGVGLFVAPAIDATGANRLPMVDSNWVVLSQDPPAGAQVEPGSTITATVKKYSDS